MSASTSPTHYKELEDAFISDANFKVDISQKMKVPNKISFNPDANGVMNWNENLNMQVPERILVVGHHQHIGTRAPPREIVFDNSLLVSNDPYPTDPRVATPPRTLTLDKYPFPGLDDAEPEHDRIPVAEPVSNAPAHGKAALALRDATPPPGEGVTPAEELQHLRRQMAKLNRRVMALELENLNRMQRDKILYGLGIAYFLLKAVIWLNKS